MVPRVPHSLLFSSPAHVEDPRWKLFNKYRFDCMNLEFLATEGEYLKAILRRAPFKAILRRAPSVPLRWLRWYNCPYSSFPRWIPMHNLRVIEVAGSRLKNLWKSKSQVCKYMPLLLYIAFQGDKYVHLFQFHVSFQFADDTPHKPFLIA